MSTQRRTSTPSTGGATPGRDDEYPTDTFDSVVGTDEDREDVGWDELVEPTPRPPAPARRDVTRDVPRGGPASNDGTASNDSTATNDGTATHDDERPTQVFSAYRDEPAGPPPVAEQLFGGTAVPEEDDTAVFTRYREGDPDPRSTGANAAVTQAPTHESHTEQFAAYRDDAYDGRSQTAGPGVRPGPGVQAGPGARPGPGATALPVPPIPPMPPVPPMPAVPTGGRRALREPDVPAEQGVSSGRRALREPAAQPGAAEDPRTADAGTGDAQPTGADEAQPSADGTATAEPELDKKSAKRLAKEQQQAAKESAKADKAAAKAAAKAEKATAEQAAKDEKAAAKAAKKAGRGRGAKEDPAAGESAVAEGAVAAAGAAVTGASALPRQVEARGAATPAVADGTAGPEGAAGTHGGAGQPGGTVAPSAAGAVAPAAVAPVVPRRKAPVLVVLLLLFIAAASGAGAWLFHQQALNASKQRPSSNIALLDKSATAEAVEQVSKAVEAVYTYDSATLDQSESQALSQITGSYVDDFKDNFAAVRALPAAQRASLSSKVVAAGVITLTERRANLLVMLDQVGRRGDDAQPVKSAVRLSVTAQRVDGQWKVSDISQK